MGDGKKLRNSVEKRSVTLAGHRTSVSLEEAFWRHLKRIATSRGITLGALIEEIDTARSLGAGPAGLEGNLSSALRLHVLEDLERALTAVPSSFS